MKKAELTPLDRLARMRASFAKDYSVLAEDYAFFTTGAATRPSRAIRKSAAPSVRKSRARS